MLGFLVAGGLLLTFKYWLPRSKMHKTPEQRRALDDKKHPPFWTRLALVLSAMLLAAGLFWIGTRITG